MKEKSCSVPHVEILRYRQVANTKNYTTTTQWQGIPFTKSGVPVEDIEKRPGNDHIVVERNVESDENRTITNTCKV